MTLSAADKALKERLGREADGHVVMEFESDVRSDRFESPFYQLSYRGHALFTSPEGIVQGIEIGDGKFS
jgi:hypothetical protein